MFVLNPQGGVSVGVHIVDTSGGGVSVGLAMTSVEGSVS